MPAGQDRTSKPRPAPGPPRRRVLRTGAGAVAGAAALPLLDACASTTSDGIGADGRVNIEMWHGQSETGAKAIESLAADFNRSQSRIRVNANGGGVVADAMLQKVTASLAAGAYPDIAYIFGSDLASVARSPKVVDLTSALRGDPARWNDFWPSVREAVTLHGKVRAAPSLLDSLAVACNTDLFRRAGIPLPRAGWTWDEFVVTAKKLTDAGHGVFGTAWPGAGDEDTTWRLWPMIWDLGGDVIDPGGKGIGFVDSGRRALETVARLAADKSVYIDPKPGSEQMYQVFLSGRMGMVITGPWKLADLVDAKLPYQVVPMPTYSGRPLTISGPDTWTVFDNGKARARAAVEFVRWLITPAQDVRWDMKGGSLPLSRASEHQADWQRYSAETVGLPVFTKALETARVRPIHPAYPQISQATGEAVVSVLLGRASPAKAVRRCADKADAALLIPR
ncbi:ABC transporter substrate-binding protein [Streptomyces sp. cg36]|uniref:ABC transporter substrate-binding protein n=1 Tax=Streptomyces sp. cg36 TaxID=3238798 RepID=UPI0034E25186